MARGSFNIKNISRKIGNSKKLDREMEKVASRITRQEKEKMIERFVSHPVSKEISNGASATNSSGTLMGGYGNLYTFIGFPAGRRPIQDIVSLIQRRTFLVPKSGRKTRSKNPNAVSRSYAINYIDETEIHSYGEARMPWESGSWIRGIEEGISSFSSYIHKAFEGGRSKKGVQAKKGGQSGGDNQNIRAGTFIPAQGYVTKIIRDFKKNVRAALSKRMK